MNITVCGHKFDTNNIQGIFIAEKVIHIDAKDDFYSFNYKTELDIIEAKNWLKIQNTTLPELSAAVTLIITTCSEFLSQTTQCEACPLKRKKGCVFTEIPMNWR